MMSTDIFDLVRTKNRILNLWEQYYRQLEVQSYPRVIQFATGTKCNIKCRFCNHHLQNDFRNLSLSEAHNIFENGGWQDAFLRAEIVALYGWGEPLFNPDYEAIFDYMTENFPKLGIAVCTNGILFDDKWCNKILPVENSEVNFSVNAASADTYQNLCSSKQFARVIKNIRHLTAMREQSNTQNPFVSMSYVATIENIQELPAFVDLAADLKADTILVQDIMLLTEDTEKLSLINCPDMAYEYFQRARVRAKVRNIHLDPFVTHQVGYFEDQLPYPTNVCVVAPRNDKTNRILPPSPYFSNTDCFDPWERLMTSIDGAVLPCCRYATGEPSLGDMYKESFQEIWNGDGYIALRRTINTDLPPPGCANCARKAGLS